MAVGRCFRLFHKHLDGLPYSLILENNRNTDEFLLFESGVVASLATKDCEAFKQQYTKLDDGYGCLGVLQLFGPHHPLHYLVLVNACVSVGRVNDCEFYRVTGVQFYPMWSPQLTSEPSDERITEIRKLVSSGMFYFSWAPNSNQIIDLGLSAQKRSEGFDSDHRFFWNRTLHLPLQRYGVDTSKWLLRCMCGGVLVKTVYVGQNTAKACLISRLSCERMGTRFNVRGVNDDGHVANFVETEQVIFYDEQVSAHVQTRGSIPLFWEQPGVQVGSHRVKMSRGFEACAPAYDRHLKLIKRQYGSQVLINLLGTKEGEKVLSQAFKAHHENSHHNTDTPYVAFDYHNLVRLGNKLQNLSILWNQVREPLERFGFFHARQGVPFRKQAGTVRTNCLDCLDRTNCAQAFFGLQALIPQLQALDLYAKPIIRGRFEEVFRELWTQNGDLCSRIYAGTGALEGKSKIKDASRSVQRTIQNNLMDGSKQEAMDLFLLNTALSPELYDRASALLPLHLLQGRCFAAAQSEVIRSLVERSSEYVGRSRRAVRVFCGTWNVNGGQRLDSVAFRGSQSLADWLLDLPLKSASQLIDVVHDYSVPIDIFAIGLEEIVDLNAGNIMKASTTNQRVWSEQLRTILSRDRRYIQICCLQLVGVCLFLFVRPQLAPFIRDVSTDMVKTGLGGAAGNKGGVAVRFSLHSTPLCFVCSHFAAGQSQVNERNSDFAELSRKLQFPMGRNIFSHDVLFWFGDFNYRIDLGGEEVKQLARERDFPALHAADQLTNQKALGNAFAGFFEGPLNFAPTYKYDTFSDDYDTSEKCRSPAWTDRVLWWQRPRYGQDKLDSDVQSRCQLLYYGRAELKTSDHRPVGAIFELNCAEVDEEAREAVFGEALSDAGPPDATVLVGVLGQVPGSLFPMELVDGVLAKLIELGSQVLLVKFVADDMWLIFKDGDMALAAMSMDGVKLEGQTLTVRLRSEDWEAAAEGGFGRGETVSNDYSLLSEDGGVIAQFDVDDESDLPESAAPPRPPPASLAATSKGRTPPPRPTAPPKRPPPPRYAAAAAAAASAAGSSLGVAGGGGLPHVKSTSCLQTVGLQSPTDAPIETGALTRTMSGVDLSATANGPAAADPFAYWTDAWAQPNGSSGGVPPRPSAMQLAPAENDPWGAASVPSPASCRFESNFAK